MADAFLSSHRKGPQFSGMFIGVQDPFLPGSCSVASGTLFQPLSTRPWRMTIAWTCSRYSSVGGALESAEGGSELY